MNPGDARQQAAEQETALTTALRELKRGLHPLASVNGARLTRGEADAVLAHVELLLVRVQEAERRAVCSPAIAYRELERQRNALRAELREIKRERDEFRIEADCGLRDYDSLELTAGFFRDALQQIADRRPNKTFDPWACDLARAALARTYRNRKRQQIRETAELACSSGGGGS